MPCSVRQIWLKKLTYDVILVSKSRSKRDLSRATDNHHHCIVARRFVPYPGGERGRGVKLQLGSTPNPQRAIVGHMRGVASRIGRRSHSARNSGHAGVQKRVMRKRDVPLSPIPFQTAHLTDVVVVYISSSLAFAVVVVKTRPCLTPPLPSRLWGGEGTRQAGWRDGTTGRARRKNTSSLVPPFPFRRDPLTQPLHRVQPL